MLNLPLWEVSATVIDLYCRKQVRQSLRLKNTNNGPSSQHNTMSKPNSDERGDLIRTGEAKKSRTKRQLKPL